MSVIHVEQSEFIPAAPERVYEILRDYENHHRHILPEQYYSNFTIETGGLGAGTVGWVKVSAMGRTMPLHFRVSEPEPGRRMVETNLETGAETSFVLSPEESGTRLTIASDYQPAGGLSGFLDRKLAPGVLQKMLAAELHKLVVYVGKLDDTWVVK